MHVIDVCSVKESGYEGKISEHRNREKNTAGVLVMCYSLWFSTTILYQLRGCYYDGNKTRETAPGRLPRDNTLLLPPKRIN